MKKYDNYADYEYNGDIFTVDISLSPEIKVGDWILIHDGRALSKITEEEARENIEFINDHGNKFSHCHR